MKKFIAIVAVLALLLPGIPAFASSELDSFTVNVSTYGITDAVFQATELAKDVRIHHILISNSDATVAQTVSFYELSDSTTTVNLKFAVDIASTSASGYVQPIQVPFPIGASPWMIHDLSIRKTSLVSTIRVTVWYR